jgi:hypothetical protein
LEADAVAEEEEVEDEVIDTTEADSSLNDVLDEIGRNPSPTTEAEWAKMRSALEKGLRAVDSHHRRVKTKEAVDREFKETGRRDPFKI